MSCDMPTAVITESSEKTMSSTTIWAMTAANEAGAPPRLFLFGAFGHVVNLHRPLDQEEQAAADQHQVSPGDLMLQDGEERLRSGR